VTCGTRQRSSHSPRSRSRCAAALQAGGEEARARCKADPAWAAR
jgi:hypothetical protein